MIQSVVMCAPSIRARPRREAFISSFGLCTAKRRLSPPPLSRYVPVRVLLYHLEKAWVRSRCIRWTDKGKQTIVAILAIKLLMHCVDRRQHYCVATKVPGFRQSVSERERRNSGQCCAKRERDKDEQGKRICGIFSRHSWLITPPDRLWTYDNGRIVNKKSGHGKSNGIVRQQTKVLLTQNGIVLDVSSST